MIQNTFFEQLQVSMGDLVAARKALDAFSQKNDLTYSWTEGVLSLPDICRAIDRDIPLLVVDHDRVLACIGYAEFNKIKYLIIHELTPDGKADWVVASGEKSHVAEDGVFTAKDAKDRDAWLSSCRFYKMPSESYNCISINGWKHDNSKVKDKINAVVPASIKEATIWLDRRRKREQTELGGHPNN